MTNKDYLKCLPECIPEGMRDYYFNYYFGRPYIMMQVEVLSYLKKNGGKFVFTEQELSEIFGRRAPYQDGGLRKIFPGCWRDLDVPPRDIHHHRR